MTVGPWQIIILAVVILVLFGGSRIGELGKGLGEGIKNFKKAVSEEDKPKPKSSAGELPGSDGSTKNDSDEKAG